MWRHARHRWSSRRVRGFPSLWHRRIATRIIVHTDIGAEAIVTVTTDTGLEATVTTAIAGETS